MSNCAIFASFRAPTQEEYDLHKAHAVERLQRKYPQLRSAEGSLREDGFVKEMINAMIVWMADTPDWSTIP